MKIKTKFQIIVSLVLSISFLLCGIIFFTVQDMNETIEKNRIANEIVKDVFELDIVSHDYVMYHEERAKTQWQLKHDSIVMLLTQASEKFKDPEEQAIVTNLFTNHESIDSIFSQLVSNYENENLSGEESATFLELEERLTSQLMVNAQTMVSSASQLGAVTRAAVVTDQQRINLLTTGFIVLMGAVIATLLFWVSRDILKPIIQFRKGTEIIAKGDLDYKIGITKRDEIGDLVKSFENMCLNLKKSYDELEVKVAKRTEELSQTNIRLKGLDKLKSMFIASMSHELRTPLNSIIGFTSVMLQGVAGKITEEQKKQLTMVQNSANHLLALINDIIDVSKIEAGKIELDIEEFNLSEIAQEVKDSFKVAAEEKDLELSLEMPEKLVIKSDERRTKQVLMNFVSNALKFTDKGKIEMNVAKKDGKAEVSVRDTGIGMKKEGMDKLFKPFSQLPIKGRPKREGTGLGLYLSKKIADLLGGEIKAESEFGKGSVFTFTLPLDYEEVKK